MASRPTSTTPESSMDGKILIAGATSIHVCDFNGGCGQKFQSSTDLLDHVAIHLDEQTVIIKLNNDLKGQEEEDEDLAMEEMDFRMCFSEHELLRALESSSESSDMSESEEMGGGGGSEAGQDSSSMNAGSGEENRLQRTFVSMQDILNDSDSRCSLVEGLRSADTKDLVNWDELFESISPDSLSMLDADTLFEESCCETSTNLFWDQDPSVEEAFEDAEHFARGGGVEEEAETKTRLAGLEDPDVKPGAAQKLVQGKKSTEKKEVIIRKKLKVSKKVERSRKTLSMFYSAEYILSTGLIKRKGASGSKHYFCPVPGCGKCYKNPNGIKYHAKYGHSAPQEFHCECGKVYSTRHGLMAHIRQRHLQKAKCADGLVPVVKQES